MKRTISPFSDRKKVHNESHFPKKHLSCAKTGKHPARLLTRIAESAYDRLHLEKHAVKLQGELTQLGCGRKNCVRDYYVEKISHMLLLLIACIVLLLTVLFAESRKSRSIAGGLLDRPGYGESGTDRSLNLTIMGEAESEAVSVHLAPRLYTRAEARKLLRFAEEELLEKLPGNNPGPDEIRDSLFIPSSLQDSAVQAEYYITPSGMIGEDGSIIGEPSEDGTLVSVSATLTCQDEEREIECSVRIFPPLLSAQEAFHKKIRDAVESAQTENPSGPQIRLPDEVDGRKLSWSYPREGTVRMLLLLLLLLPAAYWFHKDSAVQDRAKARKTQLELDYSQLLWKLTMLLSAGLTIRGSFTRIAAQYEMQKRDHEKSSKKSGTRYVYEEMLLALREMQSGTPEASAYENFGRRCGLPAYIKLGSLLSQNLKKGSKGLTSLLEHEAVLSLEQHKMAARKMGEKAGIRMLLPMILMFGVVLVILMVPAFLSM